MKNYYTRYHCRDAVIPFYADISLACSDTQEESFVKGGVFAFLVFILVFIASWRLSHETDLNKAVQINNLAVILPEEEIVVKQKPKKEEEPVKYYRPPVKSEVKQKTEPKKEVVPPEVKDIKIVEQKKDKIEHKIEEKVIKQIDLAKVEKTELLKKQDDLNKREVKQNNRKIMDLNQPKIQKFAENKQQTDIRQIQTVDKKIITAEKINPEKIKVKKDNIKIADNIYQKEKNIVPKEYNKPLEIKQNTKPENNFDDSVYEIQQKKLVTDFSKRDMNIQAKVSSHDLNHDIKVVETPQFHAAVADSKLVTIKASASVKSNNGPAYQTSRKIYEDTLLVSAGSVTNVSIQQSSAQTSYVGGSQGLYNTSKKTLNINSSGSSAAGQITAKQQETDYSKNYGYGKSESRTGNLIKGGMAENIEIQDSSGGSSSRDSAADFVIISNAVQGENARIDNIKKMILVKIKNKIHKNALFCCSILDEETKIIYLCKVRVIDSTRGKAAISFSPDGKVPFEILSRLERKIPGEISECTN